MSFSRELTVVQRVEFYRSNATFIRYIHPFRMTRDESQLLGQILKTCFERDNRVVEPGLWCIESFDIHGQSKKVYVNLYDRILLRSSESHPSQIRGEIFGPHLGSGNFGDVYKVLGTLVPQDDGAVVFKQSMRVIKVHRHTPLTKKKDIELEVEISRRTAYLHPKQVYHCGNKSYSVLHYFEGKELFDFLGEMDEHPDLCSEDRVLQIILNILYAVKEQIHDRGIVSRDLKPENMLFNERTDDIVNIDMGLAKFANQPDSGRTAGTPGYYSPEQFNMSGSTRQSDLFSLGVTIGLLLGAKPMPVNTYEQFFLATHFVKFEGIFNYFSGLTSEHQHELLTMIQAMTAADPVKRTPIRHAISNVEKIMLERKLELTPDDKHVNLRKAYESAVLLRKKMDPILMRDVADADKSYSTYLLMEMVVQELQAGLDSALEGFSDEPDAVDLFVSAMRLRLSGLKTKVDVRDKLQELTNRFFQARTAIKMCMDGINEQLAVADAKHIRMPEALEEDISSSFAVIEMAFNKYAPIVSNLPLWCDKLAKTVTKLSLIKEKIEEALAVACLTQKPSFVALLGVFAVPAMSSDCVAQQQRRQRRI